MPLPISFFQSDKFYIDIKTFIPLWTEIQHMLKETYKTYDFTIFDREIETIKQKKFYEFTGPYKESIVLRDIIYQLLQTEHKKTPITIIKEFYDTIKDQCGQIGFGHSIHIESPSFKSKYLKEKDYRGFIQQIYGFPYCSWPHHYKIRQEFYEKIESVPIEVYFALIATYSCMYISVEPTHAVWGN
jgi:hypothetical protein